MLCLVIYLLYLLFLILFFRCLRRHHFECFLPGVFCSPASKPVFLPTCPSFISNCFFTSSIISPYQSLPSADLPFPLPSTTTSTPEKPAPGPFYLVMLISNRLFLNISLIACKLPTPKRHSCIIRLLTIIVIRLGYSLRSCHPIAPPFQALDST